MFRHTAFALIVIATLLMFACGPKPPAVGYTDDTPDAIRELIDKKYNHSIYAVGSSSGPDEGIARSKAVMQARAEIAREFKSQVEVLQKDYEEAVNNQPVGEYTQVLEVFSLLEVSGSRVVKSMVRREPDNQYSAKVLVVVTAEQMKKILDEKMRAYTSYRATKAYQELERRVDNERERMKRE